MRRPFDLTKGPLLRLRLFQVAEDDHVLVVTMHHIVSDGWSLGVMWREIGALYRAFTAGESPALPELPIQYADYARWQRDWLRGDALARQLSYWKAELEGAPHSLDLPADRPPPPVPAHRGARCVRLLPTEALSEVRDLSRREGVTLFMTLVAALGALLYRVTGQDDILLGTPIAGRTHAETEALLGLFVNTLVLRVRLAGEPTFRELCARVRETWPSAPTPTRDLLLPGAWCGKVAPERDLGRNAALPGALRAPERAGESRLALPGLEVEARRGIDEGATRGRILSLALAEGARGLSISAVYNADRFDEGTVSRLLDGFVRLLVSGVRAPETPLWKLALLGEQDRRLLAAWNDTAFAHPRDTLLHERIAEQAARRAGGRGGLLRGHGTLRYGELDARGQPAGARAAAARRAPGGARRRVHGSLARSGGRAPWRAQGRRRLRAARSRLPHGSPRLHDRGRPSVRDSHPDPPRRRPPAARGSGGASRRGVGQRCGRPRRRIRSPVERGLTPEGAQPM